MTVCLAAICEGGLLIGAADRMLTADDVQFEPPQPKIFPMTTSIVIMVAGDSAMQSQILHHVYTQVKARIEAEPTKWIEVEEIATLYSSHYNSVRLSKAEQAILAPLGLDKSTFITKQREMSPDFINKVATELLNFVAPRVQTIFAGVDAKGAHLYVANDGDIACLDTVGFATIGVGYWHANSQFMFAGHARAKPFPETLLLAFSAKKRAEVAPGVGEATDMFVIGPQLGSYQPIGEHVTRKLEEIYRDTRKKEQKLARQTETKVKTYVEEITRATTPKEQTTAQENVGRDEALNQEELRTNAQESESAAT